MNPKCRDPLSPAAKFQEFTFSLLDVARRLETRANNAVPATLNGECLIV